MNIKIGSIVSGESGKTFLVDRIEGDIIYSGGFKFLTSAVLKVIPPRPKAFNLGDLVEYIGNNSNLKKQYEGILEVWEMGKLGDSDKCACLKPNGRVTSWIEFVDLQLVERNRKEESTIDQPTTDLLPIIPLTMEKEEIFNSGDRVKYIGEDAALFGILDGEILEVVEDCDEWVRVRTSNKKPISVPALDLEVIA